MRLQGAADLSCSPTHERHDRTSVARRTHRNLPHPPRHPLCQFVESLYELVRANVRKVDGNGSPLKNAVFGVYDSEEAAKNEDVALARLTTGADGLSQEGGARK